MKIILHQFFQLFIFGLFFFFLIPTSFIQCELSKTKVQNNVASGNVTSNFFLTNGTLKWSSLFQKLNQENVTQNNAKTVYINQPHLKGTFLIRKKRAHGKGWMRPTKSGGHSTRKTNSGRKPFSTTNKTKRKASIQPPRKQPQLKAYPQRKASVGYQLKQAKSGTSKLKSIPKLKLAPKPSTSLDQYKSHAPPANKPLRKASIGFKLAQNRESKKQATETSSSDNEKKDATTGKPKIQRKASVGYKLAQTKKDQTQKEGTKSKSESSSSSDSEDGHKGKPGKAKTLQKSSDGSKQETSKSESSNADQHDTSSTSSSDETKKRKTADRSSQQPNVYDTPESLSEQSETGEKAKKQQPSGDQKQKTQKSASASGNPDEPNNGPTGTSTHADTSDDSSSSEKTEESPDKSPGRVKTQRKASVGFKLEEQRKAQAAAAAAAAASTAASAESASTKAPPAKPERHYITEDRGPRDKPPKGTDFDPAEVCEQACLTTVTKNADSERFPTRQVQTDPEAGDRFVYQSAEVGREHMGRGTDMNKSARRKAQALGESGNQGGQQGGEEGQEEGKKNQAGHPLGSRFGGQGVLDNVIPQNAHINQGNWREMEAVIAQDVQDHGRVRFSQLALYDDGQQTRPTAMRFKVETLGGDLIRYGTVDNPPNKPKGTTPPPPRPADGA